MGDSEAQNPRLAMFANMDFSGVLRGRSFPMERWEEVATHGLPWVPANVLLSPLNTIPVPNPFGPLGETRLRAGEGKPMTLPARGDRPALQLHVCDILTTEDDPWPVCPRGQLKAATGALRAHGLTLRVGFEQECYITGLQEQATPAFSLAGTRAASGLAMEVQAMLGTTGTRLEQFVAEFGEYQFEVAAPPLEALEAADFVVFTREAIRDAARGRGGHATFAPKPFANAPGSGVHIHLSLWQDDRPVLARNDTLSDTAQHFLAGILFHLPQILALTTASHNSFGRLQPSSWVGIYNCWGTRNREAAVRFCPRGRAADGSNPRATLEYRLSDGSASPHIALAALIRAGVDGLADRLTLPSDVQADPATLSDAERAAISVTDIPRSLSDAVAALERSGIASTWFDPLFEAALLSVRRNDISDATAAGKDYAKKFRAAV